MKKSFEKSTVKPTAPNRVVDEAPDFRSAERFGAVGFRVFFSQNLAYWHLSGNLFYFVLPKPTLYSMCFVISRMGNMLKLQQTKKKKKRIKKV